MRWWALLVSILTLSACGPSGSARPGAFRIAQTQSFTSLDPIFNSGVGAQELAALLYSYLVKIDDEGRVVPDAATEVPSLSNGGISADGRAVTYHVRPGIRFSDGVALTAADVVWTIKRLADPKSEAPSRAGYEDVESVQALDELTVRVILKRPFAPVILYLCGPGDATPILPEHVLKKTPSLLHSPFATSPLGSGPYTVEKWQRDDRLDLRANPLYFGGRPHIEHLEIRFVSSSPTALEMLRSHEVDAYVNADDSQYEPIGTVPDVRVDIMPIDGTGALIFNTREAIMRDERARRAFAETFDAPILVAKALNGATRSSNAGRGLFQWAYDPRAFAMPPYDPGDAGRLLDAAGWKMGKDGLRHDAAGAPLTVNMILRSDKPSALTLATAIQAAERSAGVDVQLRRLAVSTLVAPPADGGPLYGGKFSVALFPFIAGFDPDVSDQFKCDRIPPHGFNKARYCNPQVDDLLDRASSSFDRNERAMLYSRVERILARDLPIDALYQAISVNAFPQRLAGQTTAVTTPFWNVAAWELK